MRVVPVYTISITQENNLRDITGHITRQVWSSPLEIGGFKLAHKILKQELVLHEIRAVEALDFGSEYYNIRER